VRTLDIAPLCETPPQKRSGMARVLKISFTQRLKWSCEAGGSLNEARLEQTPYGTVRYGTPT